MNKEYTETGFEVAVIGMTARFPGSENVERFWENLLDGISSISFYSDKELEEAGVPPHLLNHPNYVKACAVTEGNDYFDSTFFGYTPREAGIMAPQIRIFHECAWAALEDAGYDPKSYDGLIGLYAGASPNFDWEALSLISGKSHELGVFTSLQLSNKDFLCTRISHKLNLMGPSLSMYTACSTSLVAVHTACQAIINGECDMALSGGIGGVTMKKAGYLYEEGMIAPPDGHCRAFDARSHGTIAGEGVGIVVLKRLADAVADRDHIHAVIKGSAVNNDGSRKVGFTAPSIEGQAEVVKAAHQMADVEPESITYIETHGTGTILGDPVELESLTLAFNTEKRGYCAIGSVKTNFGHLDAAAGVAGLIKAVLAVKHKIIPPSLYFQVPNPRIDFVDSPFFVNTRASEWKNDKYPLRAGVNSLGIGGTNAHVIVEEYPHAGRPPSPAGPHRLFLLSNETKTGLERAVQNLADRFEKNPGIDLADAAYTLQVGRRAFSHRYMAVCATVDEAVETLRSDRPGETNTSSLSGQSKSRPIAFLFPGPGSFETDPGAVLYREEAVFRRETDRCFEYLNTLDSVPKPLTPANCDRFLSLFVYEYSLAKQIAAWGIVPHAVIGREPGAFAAAVTAGIFSLEDALKLAVIACKPGQQNAFEDTLGRIQTNEPVIPCISNVTGQWITREEAADPGYWLKDLKTNPAVNNKIEELVNEQDAILLEFGPGREFPGSLLPLNLMPEEEGEDVRHLLTQIGQLWLYGIPIDWNAFYRDRERFRIPLPTYSFEPNFYSTQGDPFQLGMELSGKNLRLPVKDMADWFYIPYWKQTVSPLALHPPDPTGDKQRWLIFTDNYGLGPQLADRLGQKGFETVTVKIGEGFLTPGDREDGVYTVDVRQTGDYDALIDHLIRDDRVPGKVLHLWGVDDYDDAQPGLDRFKKCQAPGFYSLLFLTRALYRRGLVYKLGEESDNTAAVEVIVVTRDVHSITGEEDIYPEMATILGLCRTIPQEFQNVTCRSIDISLPGKKYPVDSLQVNQLMAEFFYPSRDSMSAYRGNYRWIRCFDKLRLEYKEGLPAWLKQEGVYLITGGLGNDSLIRCEYLARTAKAGLVLTGRTGLPDRGDWDRWLDDHDEEDAVSVKIRKIRGFEELGARVLTIRADVADEDDMRSVMETIDREFGRLDGVIHGAGITTVESSVIVSQLDYEDTELHFKPKIHGLYVLKKVLEGRKIDFCLLTSSIASFLGGGGLPAYTAASIFMDAFAHRENLRNSFPWMSLNWEGTMPRETNEAFHRILSVGSIPQLAATQFDLVYRIEERRKAESQAKSIIEKTAESQLHPRPGLSTPYVAPDPDNPVENDLVQIWENFFAIAPLGVTDNFFELGGDSLNAIAVVSKIKYKLNVNLPLADFYKFDTVKEMAKVIEDLIAEKDTVVDDNLVILKRGAPGADNVFFIHAISGEVEGYIEFCNLLDSQFNYWGVQFHHPDNFAPQGITIQQLAAFYLEKIKRVQPVGPYSICGWSFGSIIAFEMIRQLEQMNETIRFFAIIDEEAPNESTLSSVTEFNVESELERIRGFLPGIGIENKMAGITDVGRLWSEVLEYLEEIGYDVELIKKSLPQLIAEALPNFVRLDLRELIYYLNLLRTFDNAKNGYIPGSKVNTTVHYFASSRPTEGTDLDREKFKEYTENNIRQWNQFTALPPRFYEITGDHYSIFVKPDVVEAAKHFNHIISSNS